MNHGEQLKKQITEDNKYKSILAAVEPEVQEQIKLVIEHFLDNAGAGLDDLYAMMQDKETQKHVREKIQVQRGKSK